MCSSRTLVLACAGGADAADGGLNTFPSRIVSSPVQVRKTRDGKCWLSDYDIERLVIHMIQSCFIVMYNVLRVQLDMQ